MNAEELERLRKLEEEEEILDEMMGEEENEEPYYPAAPLGLQQTEASPTVNVTSATSWTSSSSESNVSMKQEPKVEEEDYTELDNELLKNFDGLNLEKDEKKTDEVKYTADKLPKYEESSSGPRHVQQMNQNWPAATAEPSSSSTATPSTWIKKKKPTIIITIGMAGSGKTTMMHRLYIHLLKQKKSIYAINLDPAVRSVKYPCAIDIRDTINYKEVMKQFQLGPNGAIMTSLNLFATRFDQVLELIDKRAPNLDYILIDTPGQIEVFSWSASGQIISSSLSVEYPTVVNYVIDCPRCERPVTFMSNMLYCCSILYKTRLPFVVSFNKCDVIPCSFIQEWMKDYTKFGAALDRDEDTYLSSLSKSMSRVLEEFYCNLNNCGVSAWTGEGFDEFMKQVAIAEGEYWEQYQPFLEKQKETFEKRREFENKRRIKQFEASLEKNWNARKRVNWKKNVSFENQKAVDDINKSVENPYSSGAKSSKKSSTIDDFFQKNKGQSIEKENYNEEDVVMAGDDAPQVKHYKEMKVQPNEIDELD